MDLQNLATTVTLVAGAITASVGLYRGGWAWIRERWENRSSVVIRNALTKLQQQGEAAMGERSALGRKFDVLSRDFVLFTSSVKAVIEADTTIATFEASPDGHLIDANRTYMQWTGKTLDELLRWGWINCVHPLDQDDVRREWESACRDQRQSTKQFRMLDADGREFRVRATAKPIPEGRVCEKFAGVLHRLDP